MLTWFPNEDIATDHYAPTALGTSSQPNSKDQPQQIREGPSHPNSISKASNVLARALVVFLNRQAHIYFLSGATYLVHLHFDIEKVFPAPRGLIIERRLAIGLENKPATPLQPKAPPNSFLTPFAARIGHAQQIQHGPSMVDPVGLDFDSLRRSKSAIKDNLPRHFCLTSPLSEVGLVVHSPQKQLGASFSQSQRQDDVSALGINEEILYVSKSSEVAQPQESRHGSLMLIVTGNKERQVYTIWQGMYADSKSATLLFRDRQGTSTGAKTRRRSSFISRTGATTPALRPDEGLLDAFTVKKRGKKLSTLNASQSTASIHHNKGAIHRSKKMFAEMPLAQTPRPTKADSIVDRTVPQYQTQTWRRRTHQPGRSK